MKFFHNDTDYPKKEISNGKDRNWSVNVLIIDENNQPMAGYYQYESKQWLTVSDEPIENISFNWIYMPDWFKYLPNR